MTHTNMMQSFLVIYVLALFKVLAMDPPPPAYFTGSRLNNSTFRIVENDEYKEIPFIYAKVYPSAIVLIDTGCGGPSGDASDSLKIFLETHPLSDNGNLPINHCSKPYIIISTHCHFDHIG